ncbi:MAG: DUF3313 domain-containing protein [Nitrospira sp.]|nr:DUF3313 domain-containing protein [Nitrospira sp.]
MRAIIGVLGVALLIGASGCASTQEAKSVEKSGFLGDYSMLKEGQRSMVMEGHENEALLVYVNPDAHWEKYKKIILDPVTVWIGKDSQMAKVSGEDRQRLADALWAQLHESLKQDYELTTQPGQDVMRVQAAMTEADKSMVVLDTISSIVPQLRVLSGVKSGFTGVSAFTGSASGELKITDSETGGILLAGVDRRGGTKSLRGLFNSWNDIEEAYRFWAEKLRFRLCQWRGGTNCIEPKA